MKEVISASNNNSNTGLRTRKRRMEGIVFWLLNLSLVFVPNQAGTYPETAHESQLKFTEHKTPVESMADQQSAIKLDTTIQSTDSTNIDAPPALKSQDSTGVKRPPRPNKSFDLHDESDLAPIYALITSSNKKETVVGLDKLLHYIMETCDRNRKKELCDLLDKYQNLVKPKRLRKLMSEELETLLNLTSVGIQEAIDNYIEDMYVVDC